MPQAATVELPKRLPLVIAPGNRDTTSAKDSKLVNCYVEKQDDGETWLYRRAGTLRSSQPTGGAAAGMGMFNWLGDIYSAFGTHLYKNGASVGTIDATGGVYHFASCLGATPKLQLGNGVKAYNYDAGAGLVQITDGDFPSAFQKGWAFVDGTTYVLRPDAGIQGDDINTPTSWDPLNVLIAQITPDKGVYLAQQLVYAVALKQWSAEVFYDAGNATGSPLGTVQGARASFGCVTGDSVQSIDDILIWVCTNQSSSTQVIKMEGLKTEVISNYAIERLLDSVDFTTTYSLQFKNIGHRFYVLTVKAANLTIVYDLDEKRWHQWTDANGNYFPFVAVTYDQTTLNHQFQHESDGYIYLASESYFLDQTSLIPVDIVTPNFDGGTRRGKMMNMMQFIGDQVAGSTLQVRFNDSDYDATKWTNYRSVDLGQKQPQLMNCGTFKRRATHIHHACNTSFRLQAVDLALDLCVL